MQELWPRHFQKYDKPNEDLAEINNENGYFPSDQTSNNEIKRYLKDIKTFVGAVNGINQNTGNKSDEAVQRHKSIGLFRQKNFCSSHK